MTSDPSAPLPEDHATDHADALSLSAQLRDAVARAGIETKKNRNQIKT